MIYKFICDIVSQRCSTCSFSQTRASMSSQLCESAVNRPIQVQLDVTRASNLVTVSFPAHLLHIPFQKDCQVCSFCLCAVLSAVVWKRYSVLPLLDLLTEFSGLHHRFMGTLFFGSCFGAMAWTANIQYSTLFFETSDNKSSSLLHIFAMGADAAHRQTAFFVLRPIESILFIVHLLDFLRMLRAVCLTAGGFVWTLSIALFAICSVAGFTSNLVAAILRAQLFQLSSDGVAAVAVNDTVTSARILLQFSDIAAELSLSSSVQPFTEAFMLLVLGALIVVETNKLAAHELVSHEVARAIKLWRSAAVLIFLLPRATYAAFEASVDAFQNNDYACLGACSASCTNKFSLMRSWLDFTPECRALVAFSWSLLCLFWFLVFKEPDRVRRRHSAIYEPSDDHHAQLLRSESSVPQSSRNLRSTAARSITTAELDSSSCSYLHSKVPSADTSDPARCR